MPVGSVSSVRRDAEALHLNRSYLFSYNKEGEAADNEEKGQMKGEKQKMGQIGDRNDGKTGDRWKQCL